jgi:peptide chain release factor 1
MDDEQAAIEMRNDPDSKEFAEEEIKAARQRNGNLGGRVTNATTAQRSLMMIKNIFLEIRAGTRWK